MDPIDTTDPNSIARSLPTVEQSSLPRKQYDFMVIGAGVAGLAFTLSLPPDLRIALLTRGVLGESTGNSAISSTACGLSSMRPSSGKRVAGSTTAPIFPIPNPLSMDSTRSGKQMAHFAMAP
jgi:choline dehydrogenase-like flavoprotein